MARKNKRLSEALKASHKRRRTSVLLHTKELPKNGEATDLSFLGGLFRREGIWNYSRAKRLVEFLQTGKSLNACARYFTVKETSVKNFINELKRAASAGMSLEEYFKKGRPLQYGKKVVTK